MPRFPETKALSDIFPEERFPRAEQSLEMRKEGDPAGYCTALINLTALGATLLDRLKAKNILR